MAHTRVGVVMAGGSGERFWPLSTPDRPKQLLHLTHPDKSMLEEAVDRLTGILPEERVYLSISDALREPILATGIVPEERTLVEPTRRNTLGALCWVVASLIALDLGEATVGVVTADHKIDHPGRFQASVLAAFDVAEAHSGIVTIGIPPTRAETGYGYIELADEESVVAADGRTVFRAHAFREKPSVETAEEYVAAGRFLWNGGMFFFLVSTFLDELRKADPSAHAITLEIADALRAGDSVAATKRFERLPNISVDFAVMEHATRVYTVRADFGWDDVGAWDAMARSFAPDENGNVIQGDAIVLDSLGCIVVNDSDGGSVGIIGVHDLVVVRTKDAVLVCRTDQAQRVRAVVQALKAKQPPTP